MTPVAKRLVKSHQGRISRMRRIITVQLGIDYIGDLKKRLKRAGVSHGMLAREMGWSASQLSRSFNKDIDPTMKTVEKMERAFLTIQERMQSAPPKE